jgi:hypothetical protein
LLKISVAVKYILVFVTYFFFKNERNFIEKLAVFSCHRCFQDIHAVPFYKFVTEIHLLAVISISTYLEM